MQCVISSAAYPLAEIKIYLISIMQYQEQIQEFLEGGRNAFVGWSGDKLPWKIFFDLTP